MTRHNNHHTGEPPDMKIRPIIATAVIASFTLAACGGSDTTTDTTAAPAEIGVDLAAAGCPETVVLQTDWFPEAEHGNLYQLVGDNYTIDKKKMRVTGDLVSGGKSTGVKVEVRAGGPALGDANVNSALYSDPDILLGFIATDVAVANSGSEFPTVAVVAPFNINPQIIMWDPATYPDVKAIADLKDKEVKVRYFNGASYMKFLTATGVLDEKQIDGNYDGSPASFVASAGKDAQQGFGTMEPYFYENIVQEWRKPVAYQYLHDAGWTSYAQSLGGTPAQIEKYDSCLKELVPVIQKATIEYVESPNETNALVVELVKAYNTFWTYTADQAQAGAEKMLADKIIANSPDGTLGSFDIARVNDFIKVAAPVFTSTGSKVKEGLTADDIVTNKYIDPSIKLD